MVVVELEVEAEVQVKLVEGVVIIDFDFEGARSADWIGGSISVYLFFFFYRIFLQGLSSHMWLKISLKHPDTKGRQSHHFSV